MRTPVGPGCRPGPEPRTDTASRSRPAAGTYWPGPVRRGFTLLEMLIALAIGGFLLATLWGLLGMYAQLFQTGRVKASATQLIVGLTQQINDDLHNVVCDAGPPTVDAPASAGASPSSATPTTCKST